MMGAIETIVWILIGISVIKIFVLLVKPMAWMNFARKVYSKPKLMQFVGLVLAVVVFYYLVLVEGAPLTVVELLAATAFVALLFMIGLAGHVDDLLVEYKAVIKRGNMWKEYWLYTLLWIILLVWGAKELLGI